MLPPGSFSLATFWFDIHERSEKEPFKPPTNHPTHRDANAVRSLQLSRTRMRTSTCIDAWPSIPTTDLAACTPTVVVPFYRSPVSSTNSTASGSPRVLDQVVAKVITHLVVIPHRPGQRVLHPVRVGIAGVLSDRPAVLAWQLREQAAHERPGSPPKIRPSEPTCDPAQQLVEQLLPAGGVDVYAVACGHCLMFGPHNTRSSAVAALVYSSAGPRPTA